MARDPKLASSFKSQIAENLELGYIRKLSQEELQQHHHKVWYLPLLAAQNPNKPDKFRIVFDAAATVQGVSLNSALVKGPDPVTSLHGILTRFRQYKIGVAGDIKHMFFQIQIRSQDQQVQRFYWRDDITKDPEVYVLQVMSFGATCSPATAMYIKDVNAKEFVDQYPRAVHSIVNNHYVDDLLDGADNVDDVIELVRDVKFIHSNAGHLKVLLQDAWRTNMNWDDSVNDQHFERWLRWIRDLPQLEDVKIPRCYLASFNIWDDVEIQLHTLVDASVDCVAAVSYLRLQVGDNVEVTIVGAKTKVAPIKLTSVPRLELTAALIGSRLSNSICKALTLKISRTVFWSDSKTVLCWLRSDTKRIKGQFVSFRVSEIQETTNVVDWRYVPTRLNVADDATKWHNVLQVRSSDRWINGPPFLRDNEFVGQMI